MDAILLGQPVFYIDKNERYYTTPGASTLVARAAFVTTIHPEPNPDGRVDLTVLTPSGPRVVENVAHEEPAEAPKPDGPLVGHAGTWRWSDQVIR